MVLRLAAVALVAAVLVWSVLFVDLVRKRGERLSGADPGHRPALQPGRRPVRRGARAGHHPRVVTMPAIEHDHRFRAFGTDVRVLVHAATPLDALRVQALFQSLHRTLTRFDGGSELSALNARGGEEVAASAAVAAGGRGGAVGGPGQRRARGRDGPRRARARRMRRTHATARSPAPLVDAIVGAPVRARPQRRSRQPVGGTIALDPSRPHDPAARGVRLDLGGSAKGLAVDLAAELLGRPQRLRRQRRRRRPHRRDAARRAHRPHPAPAPTTRSRTASP